MKDRVVFVRERVSWLTPLDDRWWFLGGPVKMLAAIFTALLMLRVVELATDAEVELALPFFIVAAVVLLAPPLFMVAVRIGYESCSPRPADDTVPPFGHIRLASASAKGDRLVCRGHRHQLDRLEAALAESRAEVDAQYSNFRLPWLVLIVGGVLLAGTERITKHLGTVDLVIGAGVVFVLALLSMLVTGTTVRFAESTIRLSGGAVRRSLSCSSIDVDLRTVAVTCDFDGQGVHLRLPDDRIVTIPIDCMRRRHEFVHELFRQCLQAAETSDKEAFRSSHG